jgi:hypothetical protein
MSSHPHSARADKKSAPAADAGSSRPAMAQCPWSWAVGRRYELVALVLYGFVLVLRAPWVLVMGRFWAEEASVYLAYAWNHSFLDALTAPQLGYYNLVANVGAVFAARVPLESAPHFTTTLALFVQLIPAAAVLFLRIPALATPLRKGAALLLLLVVPANPEVYLITVNSQCVLCAAAGIVLISEAGGRADRFGKWAVLGLAGLSGVATTFLAPLFWVQWWLERRRDRLTQACIVSVCALLQFIFISRGLAQDQRHMRFNSTALVGATYAKFIAMPLAPTRPVNRHLAQLRQAAEETGTLPGWLWFVTATAAAAFIVVCWRSGNRTAMLLAVATIWVTVLSFCGSRDATADQKLLGHITSAIRYYYAPQFFFLLALLTSLGPDSRLPLVLKTVGAVWLGAALLMGLVNFACGPVDWPIIFSGPPWAAQVQQWRNDPSKPLSVWPMGWQFTLPPKL